MTGTIGDALSNEQRNKFKEIKEKHPVKPSFTKSNFNTYPEGNFKSIALLIQNNAEFRRFISLAIKAEMLNEKTIKPNDKIYIRYFYKKYSVKINGLCTEYFYTSKTFVQSYLTAIVAFSSNAQNIIAKFLEEDCKNISIDVDKANEDASKILNLKIDIEDKEEATNNKEE